MNGDIQLSKKFNTYLLIGVFSFLVFWWLISRLGLGESDLTEGGVLLVESANKIWTVNYQIVAILGVYLGFVTLKRLKEQNEIKKILFWVGAALALQTMGQAGYSIYLFGLNISAPYPSLADFFYFSSIFPYVVASVLLLKISKSSLAAKLAWLVFWLLIIGAVQIYVLLHSEYHFSLNLNPVADLAYLSLETLYASFTLAALSISRFFKNFENRKGLSLVAAAMVTQMIAEMNFINSVRLDRWIDGGVGDLIYLTTYFFIGLGYSLFLVESFVLELLIVILNSFLFIQFLFSTSSVQYVSNGTTLAVALAVSLLLFKINKKNTASREAAIRLSALTESHAKLQELDKQKTEFLNIAAHQLRTPVSIIRNYVSMVQDGDFGPVSPEIKGVLNNIYDSNQWLVRLADEFLDISRLESGQTKYHKTPGDLAKTIREVAGDISSKAKEKGLELKIEINQETLPASFDQEKMRHVILNFIENAIKYTQVGTITISAEQVDNGIAVTVADTGLGFTPEDAKHFFQKFQRGKNAHEIEVNTSTGLGLYICRKFVEGHDGKVWSKSDGLEKGSEFGFFLPNEK